MNKVFKVIWSEARNAYVVVSEIAKNHGSKSCSTKKLLTMLIATGVMTCASMAPAMAAPNVDASATVNVGKKAAVAVEEQAKVNVKKNAKVTGEGGVALGAGSVADRVAGVVGYDPTTGAAYDIEKGDAPDYVWKATKGAVSVGSGRETRQITNVAAGTADTDAVNVAQLKKVNEEALKHSTVTNGDNIVVTEGLNKDGGKEYKVALKNDITLAGDDPDAFVSISGTNGTIETTGYIATKDRVYADKGAKLADIDVTGNKISNGASSIVLDGSNVKVNDKVTIDQNGKISGVAAGSEDTDAVNVAQLKKVAVEAGKHTTLVAGDNVTLDKKETNKGLEYTVNAVDTKYTAGNGIAIDEAANNAISVNLKNGENNLVVNESGLALKSDLTGIHTISNGKSLVRLDNNGVISILNNSGAGIAMAGGITSINSIVNIDKEGHIKRVAAGEISATSRDAVNGSQLHAVATEASKHSVVTEGDNITVTPEQAEDGRMQYKVALNNDIFLSGDNDAFVDISGSKGTIWASGSVAAGNVIMDGATATISGLGNTTTAYDGFANGEGKAATEE